MKLTPGDLQLALRNQSNIRHFFFYPAIASTNDKAKELALRGAEEGTLVLADCQTAGRGRLDRHWFSPPGLGLYASFILRPRVPAERAFGASMAAGLAVTTAAAGQHVQSAVGLKWPNDVMAEGKKLAGTLAEIGVQGGLVEWCVIGIGVNVNHSPNDFPTDLRDRAISLRQLCHRRVDRLPFLLELADSLWSWYSRFLTGGIPALLPEWRRRSTLLGRTVRVETAGESYVGTALDLEADGSLRIRLESGTEEVLTAGDVSLVQYR
jgi:BirA family biotin operon repressor/biotin-[acetyl-CoA-carboxylase] ligase